MICNLIVPGLLAQMPSVTKEVEAIARAEGGVNAAILAVLVVLVLLILTAAGMGLRLTYTNIRDLTASNAASIDKVMEVVTSTVQHCEEEMKLAYQSHRDASAMFERTVIRLADENTKDRESWRDVRHAVGNAIQSKNLATALCDQKIKEVEAHTAVIDQLKDELADKASKSGIHGRKKP